MPEKLLILHPANEMYGADKVLLESVDALSGRFDIEVWLPMDVEYPGNDLSRELARRNVRYRMVDLPVLRRAYFHPRYAPALLKRLILTTAAMRRFKPSLVYVNTAALAPVLPAARLLKARTVLHLHEYLEGTQRPAVLPFMWFANKIVSVSLAVSNSLPELLQRRSTVVFNGFELPRPVGLPAEGELTFVLASRWNTWKGHSVLLAAWERANRPDARLLILGAAPPNGSSVDVPSIVSALSHPERVTILGERADVRAVLDRAHVVLVPSVRPDPLPTIAIEAAAAGRPTMASHSGGLPEIVCDGESGWLVPPGDIEAWARAITMVDADDLPKMSRVARERYEASFTKSAYRKSLTLFFESLPDSKEPKRNQHS